ncbi:MAG TPA: hypothetical protein VNC50_08355, partial [Planctomycetia bacterium]|nr:hypothetical protein [Planctomycetia bacterium]
FAEPILDELGAREAAIGPFGFFRTWSPGMPTVTGFPAAIAVHALAALPWATAAVALGMARVDPALEETAALSTGFFGVLLQVTLPLARPGLVLAALLAAMPALVDMTATDLFQVRTLAEEVYTSILEKGREGERGTLLALVPLALLVAAASAATLARAAEPTEAFASRRARLPAGKEGRAVQVAAWLTMAFLLLPVAALVWQLGARGGSTEEIRFSGPVALHYLRTELPTVARIVAEDAPRLAITVAATTAAALVLAWVWRWSAHMGRMTGIALVAWTWTIPGPVVGLGVIDLFLHPLAPDWLAAWYDSSAPMTFAQFTRALPLATTTLAVAMLAVDRGGVESGLLAGASPWQLLRMTASGELRPAIVAAALVTLAFCMAELPASKLLQPAGGEPFCAHVFSLLHNGTQNQQAALCLYLLLLAAGLSALAGAACARALERTD